MCLPTRIGLEVPDRGSLTFQARFSFALHLSGTSLAVLMPIPVGPRKRGQSAWTFGTAVNKVAAIDNRLRAIRLPMASTPAVAGLGKHRMYRGSERKKGLRLRDANPCVF